MPEGAVYVARPSRWGNPYRVGAQVAMLDNTFGDMPIHEVHITPALAVALYRAYIEEQPWLVAQARDELAGKTLCCWCPPYRPCHADVLLELANPIH